MAEQMERINFYKLASIFLRPVPEVLRSLVEVVSEQFPGGKWSIIDFLTMMGKDTSNHPSLLPPPPEDGSYKAIKEWQRKWQTFLKKWNFSVFTEQVPHLVSSNCDKWDVTLLHNVLCKVNEVGKLSKDAGVFEGVQSLKDLRNDKYGHRSDDTVTGDELEKVFEQIIADMEKLGPELSTKTVKGFIKDVQDIRKEELRFGSPHEKIIDEWKEERGRIQAWMEQMRDDVDCVKERVDEHDGKLDLTRKRMNWHDEEMDSAMKRMDQHDEELHQGRERVDRHDEELRQGRERVDRHDEELRQGRERMNWHDEELRQGRERVDRHDEELRQGRERMNRHDEDPRQRRINQGRMEVVFQGNVIQDSTINFYNS